MSRRMDYTKASRRNLKPYYNAKQVEKERKALDAFKERVSKGWRSPQHRHHGPVKIYTAEECKRAEEELRAAGRL